MTGLTVYTYINSFTRPKGGRRLKYSTPITGLCKYEEVPYPKFKLIKSTLTREESLNESKCFSPSQTSILL